MRGAVDHGFCSNTFQIVSQQTSGTDQLLNDTYNWWTMLMCVLCVLCIGTVSRSAAVPFFTWQVRLVNDVCGKPVGDRRKRCLCL